MTRTKNAQPPTQPMQVSFSIKRRNPDTGEWKAVSVNDLVGRQLVEMFTSYDGQEIVAEFIIGKERFYFAGTEKWRERMSRKGKAVTFAAGLEILRQRRPAILEEYIPAVEELVILFGGSAEQGDFFGKVAQER